MQLMKPAETTATVVTLTVEEREEALQWLRAPHLITRLKEAFHLAGIIGEEINTLVAYLAGVSRKLERPLAIIIQSAERGGQEHVDGCCAVVLPRGRTGSNTRP